MYLAIESIIKIVPIIPRFIERCWSLIHTYRNDQRYFERQLYTHVRAISRCMIDSVAYNLKRATFFHGSVTHVRSSQQRVVFHVQADNLLCRASALTTMVVIEQSCSWKKSRWHRFRDNFTILRIDVISRSRGRKWASSSWTPCTPALMDVDLKIRSFSLAAAVRLWTSTLQTTLVLLESFCQPRSKGYIKFFCAWILFRRTVSFLWMTARYWEVVSFYTADSNIFNQFSGESLSDFAISLCFFNRTVCKFWGLIVTRDLVRRRRICDGKSGINGKIIE